MLDDFLLRTVVLTPDRLQLALRRSGDHHVVEVEPWFEGAPTHWLDAFDRSTTVRERYDLATPEGVVQVMIAPEVGTVLREIKRMPGRRLAGERAEAFLLNPIAAMGEDVARVIDVDQFEAAKEEAGIVFERFAAITPETHGPGTLGLLITSGVGNELSNGDAANDGGRNGDDVQDGDDRAEIHDGDSIQDGDGEEDGGGADEVGESGPDGGDGNAAAVTLGGRHSATDPDNISTFLLRLVGLDQKKLRKNVNNELQNLSFRNLASLLIVDEEAIIKKDSPIVSGDSTQRTAQISLFKLLLTGVDDSALVAVKKRAIARAEIEGQLVVIDEMIADYDADLKELTKASAEEMNSQLDRLENSIAASERAMSSERTAFEAQEQERRDAWRTAEQIQARAAEIAGLKERFALLDLSYASDLQRLESISEAGAYFVSLPQGRCPLCGAPAGDHRHEGVPHDADIDDLRTGCDVEIAKIRQLQLELAEAVADLDRERQALGSGARDARLRFEAADALVRETLAPALSAARRQVDELYSTRAEVRRALGLVDRIATLMVRRSQARDALSTAGRISDERPGLPAASVQAISVAVEELLDAWHFPHEKPVFFDEAKQDMVLGGRRRGDQGKGLRALTHAAFTIGLQQAIKTLGRSAAGFVVLDSPLVTFREADHEDELAQDDKIAVKQAFYADLAKRADLTQIIVFENEDPDPSLSPGLSVQLFSKQRSSGRYGFFPITQEPFPS